MTINVTDYVQSFYAATYTQRHTYHFAPDNNYLVHNSCVAANASVVKNEKEGN